MGIVNITPDSFSDGGEHTGCEVEYALSLIGDGADIIDLGAQSTRPNAVQITPEEEWSRLERTLVTLRKKTDKPISVDTFYPSVAEKALKSGADIINDISGVIDGDMLALVRDYGCGYVITHNSNNTEKSITEFFRNAIENCGKLGVDKAQLCLDVGIGFGKTYEENLRTLARLNEYKIDGVPLLLGVSRKSVIGIATGESEPKKRLFGNISVHSHAVMCGVDIIRLHDVKNEKQAIAMSEALRGHI